MPDLGFAHRFVPATGTARDTILLLHGTGGNEDDLIPLARQLGLHANLLSPRGNVLEHGAPRFFRRIREGVLDLDDLRLRARELSDFVGAASKEYRFDPRRVIALGYSNGANVAIGMLLERPGTLRAAALLRAMLPYEPPHPPALGGTDVLLAAGERDPYSQRAVTERLAGLLVGAGARVRTSYADAGHELSPDDLQVLKEWLGEVLG